MLFRNHKTSYIIIGLLVILALGIQGVTPAKAGADTLQFGTYIRVSPTGATSGSCGTDWSTPCDLQYALSFAASGAEIWVQEGTYKPGTVDRNSTFLLVNGVGVYGGFDGTETLRSERNSDPATNNTILSGDIGIAGDNTDNAYHVVKANFAASTATILDGFTIRDGNADGATENFGGGLFSNESNPTLKNIIFTNNRTNGAGGGVFAVSQQTLRVNYTKPTFTNVVFSGNIAVRGGGIFTQNTSPIMTNVTFAGNTATGGAGGGMNNQTLNMATDEYSVPELTNVTFSGNLANGGGGLFNADSNPILTNVTFSGNSVSIRGGAIFNEGASPILKNVTMSGNSAPEGTGSAIRNVTKDSIVSNPVIENSILWGNLNSGGVWTDEITSDGTGTTTLIDSIIQGGCPSAATCTNVLSTNPVLSGLANHGGFTQTRALGQNSSAINTGGVNTTCDSKDQRGATRPQGAGCDIGAFEAYLLTVTADPKTITYGDPEPVFTVQYGGLIDGDTSSVINTPPTCNVAGAHTNAGSYSISCSGGSDDKYVLYTYVNGTLTIDKATPTLSVTNSPVTYDGSAHAATVTGSVPGTPSNILTGGLASQTNAGTYAVTADFVPTDTTNYNSLTDASAGSFTINKADPVLSVSNSPVTYNGFPKSANVNSSVTGSVTNILTGGSATQTNAGTYAVTANFTPSDTANYNTLTDASAGNFIIEKANATLSVTNSPVEYNGSSHAATVESAIPGTISNVLTGGSATQTNVGTYAVTANFLPTDTTNFNTLVNASAGNFIISPDITPPDTQIVLRPATPSTASVSFTFTSDDVTATFECQLDGKGFSTCTNPKDYTSLGNGIHTFEVRGKDLFDNVDISPATYTWSVSVSPSEFMSSTIIVPTAITNESGSVNGSLINLAYFEQSDLDDTPSAYVNFQTPGGVYIGYQSYYIPNDIQTRLITNTLFQVNVKGSATPNQTWTWSIYDWNSKLWVTLGDNVGADAGQWYSMTISIRNIQRYISPQREIRIQLRSRTASDDFKVDYEALHLTYRSMPVSQTTPVVSPTAPRPGVASVGLRMVR